MLFFAGENTFHLDTMPGHIKKSEGPDPDPSPWLVVSPELKNKLKSKPYDPKKSCWVPNKATHGYDEGLIESTEGDKVTVMILESKEVIFLITKITTLILNIGKVNQTVKTENKQILLHNTNLSMNCISQQSSIINAILCHLNKKLIYYTRTYM